MLASRGQSLATIQAFPGLAGRRPLGARRRAPRADPGGRAAAPPPAHGRRGDRPARQGEGGRLGPQGRDEGRRRPHQAGRGAARGGEGGDRALPAGGAEPARRERARRARTRRPTSRCGGSATPRAFDFDAEVALGPRRPSSASSTSSARRGSRARASPSTGTGGARLERALIQFMLDLHGSRGLPRGDPAVPRHRGDAHRHRPAAQVRGRPLQDLGRRPRPLPDPDRRGAAHQPPPRRDPRRRPSCRRSTSPSRPASARRRAPTARTCAASSASTSSTRWSS